MLNKSQYILIYFTTNTTSMVILIYNILFVYVVFADFLYCFDIFLIQNNFFVFHAGLLASGYHLQYNVHKLVI